MILERNVESYLRNRVARSKGEVRKVQWVGRRGAPDRLVLMPGGSVWVELKRPRKGAESYQEREHARMRRAGLEIWVCDSADAVDKMLEECFGV